MKTATVVSPGFSRPALLMLVILLAPMLLHAVQAQVAVRLHRR